MFMRFTQPSKFSGVKSIWIGDIDTTGLSAWFRENTKKARH